MPGMDWDEVEKRLKREAEEAQAFERIQEIANDDVRGILEMTPDQLRLELIKEFGADKVDSPEFKTAMEDYRKAIKAAKGNFFNSPDPTKARKIIKSNDNLDRINDKTKSWWDCGVLVITGLFVTLTGAIYGLTEVFS